MKSHWLAYCAYWILVVDRIEPPYAVIEWSHSATFEEIPQNRFPTRPREGQVWSFHSSNNSKFDATFDTQKPWHSYEITREAPSYKLRRANPRKIESTSTRGARLRTKSECNYE